MSSSFLRDFYRRYYGKEMLQRALCLLTVHRKKPYNNSGSFEKRKEIIFMSHKIIKPAGYLVRKIYIFLYENKDLFMKGDHYGNPENE